MSRGTQVPIPAARLLEARHQPLVVRARLEAPGMVAELCDFPVIRGEQWTTAEAQPVLSLGLSALLPESQGRFRPGPGSRFASFGPLHFRPRGVPLQVRYAAGTFSSIRCRFEPGHFAALTGLGDDWTDGQLAACLDIRSARIEDALLRLSEECLAPARGSDALAGALGTIALVELARYLDEARARGERRRGGLSARNLRRVAEHVADTSRRATVAELAALCGLSRHHFMRAFRLSTGLSVAKYVEAARISRARTLLVASALPVSAIAATLGFPRASAFSAVFRRATGRSPRDYRDHMR